MFDIFLDKLKAFFSSRLLPVVLIFSAMFVVLIHRLFVMQIVEGGEIADLEQYKLTKQEDIKSVRGNIYAKNGELLVENVLKYSVVMSNSGLLTNNAQRNTMILKTINLLKQHNFEIELDFPIVYDEFGNLIFTVSGNAELRFKKNAYCVGKIADLTEEQKNSTAEEVYNFLKEGNSSASMFQISDNYTKEEILQIMMVRYTLLIMNPAYSKFTLASDIDEKTAAAVKENMADLPGVEVIQQTSRVYYDSKYFSHIVGYTGLINANEIEELNMNINNEEDLYQTNDIVGKIGIEKELEPYLFGKKGIQEVVVNDSGKILDTINTKEPIAGNDVYLTIDRDLQVALYHILERNIAAILLSKLNNDFNYGTKGDSASGIRIPIYEVYNALLANNVIQISSFKEEDATELEKRVLGYFEQKKVEILSKLRSLLSEDSAVTNTEAGEELEVYLIYVYEKLKEDGVVISSAVDKTDEIYLKYANNEISLSSYLQYAIIKNWVDLSKLNIDVLYIKDEIYEKLIDYAFNLLIDDRGFEKNIYKTLIFTKKLSGTEICLLLFDQGVLEYNEENIKGLKNGQISPYTFMRQKIENLEITPGQLALEPCSGSIVVTNTKTGKVIGMSSYPSYDNNKLANKIDWDYYQTLLDDSAHPLNNRPTKQVTTTGSTFKPLTSLIGLGENVITTAETIRDLGVFSEIEPPPKCWKYPGSHGSINVSGAIMHSCNYFFYEVGYRLSKDSFGIYNDALGISKIRKYAEMFGFGQRSGVEVEEAEPFISDKDAIRTSIGYGHKFAPIQISRYITAVANSGNCFNLTLLDRVSDEDGKVILDNRAELLNKIEEFSQSEWDAVHQGMYNVVNTSVSSLNKLFGNLGVKVAGKTGTAQVSKTRPNHALFVAYAPYEDPEISVTVVIPNGYTSANAAMIGREVMGFYFNGENKEALLNGTVKAGTATTIKISD